MGGNEVKRVRIGVFIGEEIGVDKDQLIWPLVNVRQAKLEHLCTI